MPIPTGEAAMGYIFVSYSHKNKATISRLVDTLEAAGYVAWIDHHTEAIPGGSLWRREIVAAIEKADTFLLALSPQSVESDEVRKELDIAGETKRPIVPIEIQTTTIPQEMQYLLAGRQRISLTTNWDDGVTRLLYALRKAGKAKTGFQIGLSEEGRNKVQSILSDPNLSIEEKVRRFKSTFDAEAEKEREELSNMWAEQDNRQDKIWMEMRSTNQRISDLQKELYTLRQKQTLPKHTEEVLEREIQELRQKRDVLEREDHELRKEIAKYLDESSHRTQESTKRMRAMTEQIKDDTNRLIKRIFEKKE
jgi:hypothetical protein